MDDSLEKRFVSHILDILELKNFFFSHFRQENLPGKFVLCSFFTIL